MSASVISTADLISHRVTIYLGIPVFILGVIGGLLNLIVFLSLQTFRRSSCASYLAIMSIADVAYLVVGLLTYIMINGFNIDWTQQSRFYCIFRQGFNQVCLLIALTCLSLATIDQFLATCSSTRWQQLCNIKLARRLCLIFSFLWFIYGIAFYISYDLVPNPSTGYLGCTIINGIFQQYYKTFHILILVGVLPISITVLFGCLAYRNVKQLSYRAVPLVRRELDKQLTVMVLIQVVFNFFAITPYTIINAIILNPQTTADPVRNAIISCARILSIILLYLSCASPFYIYLCASERFRHQFVHVFFKLHLQRWHHRNVVIDLVTPQH